MAKDHRKRQSALEEFASLLRINKCKETAWQDFFDRNPFVLTESLPLRLSAVYSQVRLASGRPDYVFIEGSNVYSALGFYGIIELKRPEDRIIKVYSTKHIIPTSALTTASTQAERYIADLAENRIFDRRISFSCGNSAYVFIIIGRTAELLEKIHDEIMETQFRRLLPPGFQLIPYDDLFLRFKATVPPQVHFLVAEPFHMHSNVTGAFRFALDRISFIEIERVISNILHEFAPKWRLTKNIINESMVDLNAVDELHYTGLTVKLWRVGDDDDPGFAEQRIIVDFVAFHTDLHTALDEMIHQLPYLQWN